MFYIVNEMFRTSYSRFRGGLLSLVCNEGRYDNTPFVERLCPLCKNGIETPLRDLFRVYSNRCEFHFFQVYVNEVCFTINNARDSGMVKKTNWQLKAKR